MKTNFALIIDESGSESDEDDDPFSSQLECFDEPPIKKTKKVDLKHEDDDLRKIKSEDVFTHFPKHCRDIISRKHSSAARHWVSAMLLVRKKLCPKRRSTSAITPIEPEQITG